jgi:putative ABC transport system substrate-binding protein
LELLKQVAPGVKRALVLRSTAPNGIAQFAVIQSMAPSIGIEVTPGDLRDPGEVERAVSAFARGADCGLVVTASGLAQAETNGIVTLAARYKLPAVYAFRDMVVVAGGLISYGPDWLDQYRLGAEYVDRILKGAKPADLPAEQPTRYYFTVNLTTAAALGLTIPTSLQLRADEVVR